MYSIATYYHMNIRSYNFEFILYQSNNEYYDGVKQWSRRHRKFYSVNSKNMYSINLWLMSDYLIDEDYALPTIDQYNTTYIM